MGKRNKNYSSSYEEYKRVQRQKTDVEYNLKLKELERRNNNNTLESIRDSSVSNDGLSDVQEIKSPKEILKDIGYDVELTKLPNEPKEKIEPISYHKRKQFYVHQANNSLQLKDKDTLADQFVASGYTPLKSSQVSDLTKRDLQFYLRVDKYSPLKRDELKSMIRSNMKNGHVYYQKDTGLTSSTLSDMNKSQLVEIAGNLDINTQSTRGKLLSDIRKSVRRNVTNNDNTKKTVIVR